MRIKFSEVYLVLVLSHQSSVHEVLKVRKAFLDSEADGPGGHAVGEQDIADDVPPHQPLPFLLAGEEGDDEDGHVVRPGQQSVLGPPSGHDQRHVETQDKGERDR